MFRERKITRGATRQLYRPLVRGVMGRQEDQAHSASCTGFRCAQKCAESQARSLRQRRRRAPSGGNATSPQAGTKKNKAARETNSHGLSEAPSSGGSNRNRTCREQKAINSTIGRSANTEVAFVPLRTRREGNGSYGTPPDVRREFPIALTANISKICVVNTSQQ